MKTQRITLQDFYLIFVGAGHYRVSYFSPVTNKEWTKLVTDMTLIDEFKNTETSDHTQTRLKELRRLIKA